jgi:glycosyltransferase involved in cell wall biosynthesis
MRPRIIFFCGRAAEPWAPPSLDSSGIGGSETAVVKIAQRFARDGWRVDVYNGPGQYEGEYADVGYWEPSRLRADEACDVLVAWRQPALRLPLAARARVLWCHDWAGGDAWRPHLGDWDRVLGVSATHARFLADAYALACEKVGFVPNGVDLERFDPTIPKEPFSAIYASSPDRGLLTLLDLWPRIAGDEASARLTVAYGFDTMQAWIDAGRHDLQEFKDHCLRKMEQTPRVEYVGRLGQDELARRYAATVAWLYPSDFLETSCISAMEAMAGGAVPICSSVGAIKETVGDGGLVVWGPGRTRSNPYSPAWRDYFVRVAQGVLFERQTRLILEAKARERAKALTWDASYQHHWKPLVEGLLRGAPAQVAPAPERELVAAG